MFRISLVFNLLNSDDVFGHLSGNSSKVSQAIRGLDYKIQTYLKKLLTRNLLFYFKFNLKFITLIKKRLLQ